MTDRLRITEIYKSIQGESTWAGLPCVFVRTTGCNLRCGWCDSEFSFFGGSWMTLDEILARVVELDCKLVELTGGEPLLQPAVPVLAKRLLEHNCTVLVETSGERPIDVLPAGVIRIMDLKCPDSGECESNRFENIAHLNFHVPKCSARVAFKASIRRPLRAALHYKDDTELLCAIRKK